MKYRTAEEWSFEQAQAEQEGFSDKRHSYLGPIFIWAAFRRLEGIQKEFEKKKDGFLILQAIRICANHDIVMPEWLARAFISRYDKVLNCRVKSWDEAFDPPFPKGTNLNALRKRRLAKITVHNLVIHKIQQNPLRAIDRSLFEEVSQELDIGIGRTEVEKLYYTNLKQGLLDAKKVKRELTGKIKKSPKKSRK